MRTRIPLLAAALLLPLGAAAQPLIQSQEGIALQNEILQLQQQIQQLQAQGGGGGSALGNNNLPPPPSGSGDTSLTASLLTQVQQLQSQVQSLSGQVSNLQHQVDTQNAQLQKEIGDLQFQMNNGGAAAGTAGTSAAGAAAGAAASSPQASAAPAASTTSNDPKSALAAALAAYQKHDYATAQSLAQSIVTNHKSAPQAYRAQYLVAQCLAAQGQPQQAAIAFDNTYNMNHTGTYAPRALLGLASSLAAIQQNQAACDTLASLNSQFPDVAAKMQADVSAVSKRAHCG
ncbi:tol-pal system YbgF family protein [Acidocella sp.]|uniref:tetratricopeptide repeat protein n=1 Tax=Acidocella sp. TaxID=50710 RepID=UPI00260CF2BF|nr:tetratricopeptide repeat protein [Acidocella sp.]